MLKGIGTLFTKGKHFVILMQFSSYTKTTMEQQIREFIAPIQQIQDVTLSFGANNQSSRLQKYPSHTKKLGGLNRWI